MTTLYAEYEPIAVALAVSKVTRPHFLAVLDFFPCLLFRAGICQSETTMKQPTRAHLPTPEVNTRQRAAPSGAFWFCLLFQTGEIPMFRKRYSGQED